MPIATMCRFRVARGTALPVAALGLWLLLASGLAPATAEIAQAEPTASELRAAKGLDTVRGDPLALYVFLKAMPKGAELHNHLHSAVFAETLIGDAVEDKLCVDQAAHAFAKPQAIGDEGPVCGEGAVPAADAYKDLRLYNGLIDAFSMRGFVPAEGVTGHYIDLKELVRNSMEYSFLPGPSLWNDKGGYARFVAACLNEVPGTAEPSGPCASFLAVSDKATQQWELERRFRDFESTL